ncbi:hypothetical protein LO772_11580 [Yinghuangia sp. ASG 101]|uniref:hypothetical protein n=1 Tax=Yinghuangia sp. ASG 101 TaxID=2896848 RepID=UPI001E511549|nr:hypothetical protein [Yinghuangia sp. ASG 101]UGQ14174.1 hypothetical protein LO772_11580 [Yinghuangia sp. ASG 101]
MGLVPNPIDVVVDLAEDAKDGTVAAVNAGVEAAKDGAGAAKDWTVDRAQDAADWTADQANQAAGMVADGAEAVTDSVVDTAVDAAEMVAAGGERVGGWVNDRAHDVAELFEDPFYRPTYEKQPDRSVPAAPSQVKVTPEELAALSGAARSVADRLVPLPASVETCADVTPGQMRGFQAAPALLTCCQDWAASLRRVAEQVTGVVTDLTGNATAYTATEQTNTAAFTVAS